MELLKLLSANEIVAQILTFFLVLWLLRAFMWKRLLRLLDERKERIASEFKAIEDAKSEISGIKAAYDGKIALIEEEAKKRMHEAVAEGAKITEAMRKKAQEEAQDIIESAKAAMKEDLAEARVELREELVNITIKAAENVIEEKLSVEQDRKIVESFLDKIDKVE
ncbi:MAG: F0F1 ATP synthase subunit B [Candidatus Omnitrophota bacterium]|nr:F0F1 ATP synthase subunit B [Candidatus Omnitrophota bacterium]